ncbi:FG-GAP repeat domain-containing protein [Nannocystis pusilla]|uniref:FG-GAP repeat domain-containing protein n=1 Tax=Nannocystis pusilla TaxID=889268 RepID=UPI003DA3BF46
MRPGWPQGDTTGATSGGDIADPGAPTEGQPWSASETSDYHHWGCECPNEGDAREYEVDGQSGAQFCEGYQPPDACYLYWSECRLCEPGELDVVMLRADPLGAEILEYAPDVGFTSVAALPGVGVTAYDRVAVGDIDGDAVADVVAQRDTDGSEQRQIWSQLVPGPTLAIGGSIGLGPVADVDGDGRGDVVAPSREWWKLHVIYVDAPCIQTHELKGPAENLAAGDIDSDGKADIVAGTGASVWVLRTNS